MRAEAAPRPRLSDLRPQRPGCPQVILTCTASRSPLLPLCQEVTQKPSLRGHHTGSWAGPSTSDAPRPAPPPSRRSLPLSPPLPAFLGPGVFLRHSVRSLCSIAKSEASGELCGARPQGRGPDAWRRHRLCLQVTSGSLLGPGRLCPSGQHTALAPVWVPGPPTVPDMAAPPPENG